MYEDLTLRYLILATTLIINSASGIPSAQSEDFKCLSRAVYAEARGESTLGQILVAKVILNRLHSTPKRSTLCKVIYEPSFDKNRPYACQFSFTCNKQARIKREKEDWEKANRIAYQVMNDNNLINFDLSFGAMFYTRCGIRTKWLKNMKLVRKEGAHCFYKEELSNV